MKIALVASDYVKISKSTKKGTEIFYYTFANNLAKQIRENKKGFDLEVTSFAAGNSDLPFHIESIKNLASVEDKRIDEGNYKLYELGLLAKAFSQQDLFDLYHIHISNGEYILPFAQFVKKPILVTMHGGVDQAYDSRYFSFFKNLPNVHYLSISNSQRRRLPNLNYIKTIYHGVNVENTFRFNQTGGQSMLWAGRGVPDKGLDIVLQVVKHTRRPARIFPILKAEHMDWFIEEVIKKRNKIKNGSRVQIEMDFDLTRKELIRYYQSTKLFLFPIQWEEPFGLVMIESLACGTPVVAFARGSVPEVIKDGETGFIVNFSESDKRGNWITKKTGIEGLCEAVERIYSMTDREYKKMRRSCRDDAVKRFNINNMVSEYVDIYKKLTNT